MTEKEQPYEDIIEGEFESDELAPEPADAPPVNAENSPDEDAQPDQRQTTDATDADRAPEMLSGRTRQKSANRLSIFPLAMGFIGLGVLLLLEDYVDGLAVSLAASTVILIGSLVLTYVFRFFTSGRRERGLFFLAVVITSWGALLALSVIDNENFPLNEFWPLLFAGVGAAFFLTFMFERSHQVGLVFPGVILLFTAGIAFLVTLDVIDEGMRDTISDYWPLLLAFIGITLLPSALQEEL
jgi:hypothetical protein